MHPRYLVLVAYQVRKVLYVPIFTQLRRIHRVLPEDDGSTTDYSITTMTSANSPMQDRSNSFHYCASRPAYLPPSLIPVAEFS